MLAALAPFSGAHISASTSTSARASTSASTPALPASVCSRVQPFGVTAAQVIHAMYPSARWQMEHWIAVANSTGGYYMYGSNVAPCHLA